MSQHALIDGFFTFWAMLALWSLWECLRQPQSRAWLALYGAALGAMVLTKENAFFVYVAVLAVLAVNYWRRFGEARPALLTVTVAAPAFALLMLVLLAGGPGAFIETYKLLVAKAQVLEYAIRTGDGPWHRYLIDLLALSPLVLILALGAVFSLMARREERELAQPALYLLIFIAASYAIMILPKYGMNLRYATIWDFPLRFLAVAQIIWLTARWPARQGLALLISVVILCGYDFRQYQTCFVEHPLYELATPELLHVLDVVK
jgi:4-amino-4-deoxy-L-arabinose transferase-like glycosyltransferase